MPSAKTAPEPAPEEDDDETPAKARERILAKMENKYTEEHKEWNRVNHIEPGAERVRETIKKTSAIEKKKSDKKLEGRKLKRYNSMIKVHFIIHTPGAANKPPTEQRIIIETTDSIYLNDLKKLVATRLGASPKKTKLVWLDPDGETIVLDTQEGFKTFVDREWCRLPWVLHCYEDSPGTKAALTLGDSAKALFDRFDANANGVLEKSELARMLKELDRERLQISESMVETFIESEFGNVDADKSGTLSLSEFSGYVTSMASWMRAELMERAHHKNVFATLAARAMEIKMTPTECEPSKQPKKIPPDAKPKGGVSVEVPGGPRNFSSLTINTLAPIRIEPFFDADKRRRGEFMYTPAVQIAVERTDGKEAGAPFEQPVELTMPHCFCAEEDVGTESVVFLGCPEGETQWKTLDALTTADYSNPFTLHEGYLTARVPWPGIFCGFSSPDVEDICRVRVHLFTLPTVPTDVPTSVRLHICPELPDQIEELELSENSEWGLSTRAGDSQVLHLYQGTTLEFELQGITKKLVWHGSRIKATFTYQPSKSATAPYFDDIKVAVVEGEGRRAGRVEATAKRAGISTTGYSIPFKVVPALTKPPPPPPVDKETALHERTQYDFTIVFKPPLIEPPDLPVVKYAIELSTCGESGTYMAFQEIWQGMPKQLFRRDDEGEVLQPEPETPLHYTLIVDPGLFGRLRLRCWNDGERRPSVYSEEIKLERFQGKFEDQKDLARTTLEAQRAEYLGAVADVSPNAWSSDTSIDPTAAREPADADAKGGKGKEKGSVKLAPVPYDMPLPDGAKGAAVQECGRALAALYEEVGVDGGGSGALFGLRIDHVLHAIVSGSTVCTLAQPLMAMIEVMHYDVLAPTLETVVVLKDEWTFMLERVWGQVQMIASLRGSYAMVVEPLRAIMLVMIDLRDTMRQCETDLMLHLHLTDKEYPKSVRRELKQDVLDRMVDVIWRLSTELLKMQLSIKEAGDQARLGGSTDVLKCQFIEHLNVGATTRKKGFFSWMRKSNA